MSTKPIRVIDKRNKEKFVVDDVYLNGYGKKFGPTITSVYISLCRHANREQESWPSEEKIGAEYNISARTVRYALKVLREYNLVQVDRVRTQEGRWLNNHYILLDKSVWTKPEAVHFLWTTRGNKGLKPEEMKRKPIGSAVPIKELQQKDTHNKERKNLKLEELRASLKEKGILGNRERSAIQDQVAPAMRK